MQTSPTTRSTLALLTASLLLGGCNSMPRRDPAFSPSFPAAVAPPPQSASGSIYQRGYDFAYHEDVTARRVGDTLTIRLTEATRAQKSSKTTTDRSQTSTIANPTILGTTPQFDVPGVLPLASTNGNTLETRLSSDHAFEGESDSAQENVLTGDITVTIAEVLPNGHFMVRGEKRLNLNQGNEYVKISGIVRPSDIGPDNAVASTRLADATIIYNQDGAGGDANKMAWIARFFISALFPF